MISLILLTGMTTSSYAMSIYNKDGNTLDIYGRVEGKIASGENSYAGSETRRIWVAVWGFTSPGI